jgi:hypothetical protein
MKKTVNYLPKTSSVPKVSAKALKKRQHPVYRLRQCLGISQRLFGELLGFSHPKNRVSAIENASYGLSRKTRLVMGILSFVASKKLVKELILYLRDKNLIPPRN